MLEERFRLVYLSKNSTGIRQINLTLRHFLLICILLVTILTGLAIVSVGVFTRLFHNYRITSLENDREHLQKELLTLKERVSVLGHHLAQAEKTGDELRNVAGLDPIDDDTRQVGIGGPGYYGSYDGNYIPDEVTKTAMEMKLDLDQLERSIHLEKASLAEIEAKLDNIEDRRDHFPSIWPVLKGTITSRFGWRIHPLTNRNKMHEGIDIPKLPGTAVLATADGVIEIAKKQHTLHKDYGREVVINHGNGFETRYAHLSTLAVTRGQKVKRWDKIGEVGDTGFTQGYHLHYEVILQGKKVDPEIYIIN